MAIFLLGHGFDQLEYRCQKQLLQAWDGKSPLYYWDSVRPPYSAQFYSSGKVQRLEPGTLPPDNGTTYLAMKRTDYHQHRSLLSGWKREAEERLWLLLSLPAGPGNGNTRQFRPLKIEGGNALHESGTCRKKIQPAAPPVFDSPLS